MRDKFNFKSVRETKSPFRGVLQTKTPKKILLPQLERFPAPIRAAVVTSDSGVLTPLLTLVSRGHRIAMISQSGVVTHPLLRRLG